MADEKNESPADTLPLDPGVKGIPRVVSLIVLLAVVMLIGVLFFRVMAQFLVPLFLAAVLTVIFQPLHQWVLSKFPGRNHLSALITTSLIGLAVLAPTGFFAWKAADETSKLISYLNEPARRRVLVKRLDTAGESALKWARENLPLEMPFGGEEGEVPAKQEAEQGGSVDDDEAPAGNAPRQAANDNVKQVNQPEPTQGWVDEAAKYISSRALPWVVSGFAAAVSLAVGLSIMIFALYYFFADGPSILVTLMHLSPLDDDYERELLEKFSSVSRAVVLATLLSAVVQGLLAGVGYYFALDDGPVFLLTVLTMLLAIVPFVGATAVWVPVAAWVMFMQPGGFWPGVVLALYGAGIVSTIDNFIKPYVLHGQSNLHPLLALLSVLGGLQLLGPIGILVGPMLVAFMQALLEMLRKELDGLQSEAA